MADEFSDNLVESFPTSVLWRRYRDLAPLNAALRALISRLRDTLPNEAPGSSTYGGYQTDTNFLYRDEAPVKSLQALLYQAVQGYLPRYFQNDLVRPPKGVDARLWGWAVIMREGDHNMPHVHPDAHLSGVYYVEVPQPSPEQRNEPEPGGSLVLFDPRSAANMYPLKGHRTHQSYLPVAGSLVIFPSYLMHAVNPFRGPGERISIAFNARLTLT